MPQMGVFQQPDRAFLPPLNLIRSTWPYDAGMGQKEVTDDKDNIIEEQKDKDF